MRWRIASINDLPIKDASANITGSSVDAPITIHHSATWAFRGDKQSGHANINARRMNTTAEVSRRQEIVNSEPAAAVGAKSTMTDRSTIRSS
jgi:hypothetical protein